jgi:hypothetical protein
MSDVIVQMIVVFVAGIVIGWISCKLTTEDDNE